MSNSQPNSRNRLSLFAIIIVVVLLGSLWFSFRQLAVPLVLNVMAVSQEQYMSTKSESVSGTRFIAELRIK